MQELLERLLEKNRPLTQKGKLAKYIPELARQDPSTLAVSVVTVDGETVTAGECPQKFTIQSISKVITLILALMDHDEEDVFDKVGMEPAGDPYNSIYKLEMMTPAKPLNPMINAGALVVSSMIVGGSVSERLERILDLVRRMADNPEIGIDSSTFRSELTTAYRNRSLAYFLKEYDVIGDVEETLELYVKHCAIALNCLDLARVGLCLAQYGKNIRGEQVIPRDLARLVKTFMVTCGMYNASGEFAIRVGIPAKSGVSGGILASVPETMGIGVYGPALDDKGNSIAGIRLLEDLAKEKNLSIF
ncbi:glutaminase [Marinithermofilum abyssi]|uniref:Glutaminase n=1 Tax=Marinithermofilum abyssi TaxID=1571185 RepID=A0A8J2Y9C4_9BACL|nr:glutaminase A [Marinithermofilum abyssi]GGE19518.1 glutaminase [Marinithermofilum abyssi]